MKYLMPKKKGDLGGNPNPVQNEIFKKKRHQRVSKDPFPNEPLASKPLTIKLYQFVVDALEELPKEEKVSTLRDLITEFAIQKLGAKPSNSQSP